ncbi:hypothetical protein FAUST_1436 [Fusarium austroamericanum]|uniref:Uncharacterized protein n=1 Tax=Fusarium austroamericanum TaxID=282268 RepID=A0AAN6C904_FUSAU|nr:hypothetical protein FAUST_1436 [Fusarium austroamericanum]
MLGQDSRQTPQSDRGGKLFSAGSVHHHLRRSTGVQGNGQQNRQGSAQFVAEKGEARASPKSLEFRLVGSLQRHDKNSHLRSPFRQAKEVDDVPQPGEDSSLLWLAIFDSLTLDKQMEITFRRTQYSVSDIDPQVLKTLNTIEPKSKA